MYVAVDIKINLTEETFLKNEYGSVFEIFVWFE